MVHRRAIDEPGHDDEHIEQGAAQGPSLVADILGLQRSAGNAVVSRAIAARQPAKVGTESSEEELERAFFDDDWDRIVALATNSTPLAINRIMGLTVDELRHLDDAIRRADREGSWLAKCVNAQFDAKKVPEKQQAPGAGYGAVEVKNSLIEDGDPASRPKKNFKYRFEITFTPNPMAMGSADEIAFIQTARIVDIDTGKNASPYGKERMTEDNTKVDRLSGKDQGWYGMTDEGGASSTMRPWRKSDFGEPAWMRDTPTSAKGNREYHFETAVVCRKGHHAGKVYATVQWGFEVDEDLVVTPYEHDVFNKETPEFDRAVEAWNEQGAGPEGKRNSPDQRPLPTNLR